MRTKFQLHLFLIAACLLAMPTMSASAGVPDSARTISTTGEAALYAVPDEAFVSLAVNNFAQDLDKALSANADGCTRLAKALNGLNIDEKDICTSQLTVEPQTRSTGSFSSVDGYSVLRVYTVTVKDIAKFENLVQTALKNGADRISGLVFDTTQSRKFHDQARADAIHAAKEKAEALASELGCKIGMPRTITENLNNGYSEYEGPMNNVRSSGEPAGEGGTLPSGQIAISASISVTFDLLPQ